MPRNGSAIARPPFDGDRGDDLAVALREHEGAGGDLRGIERGEFEQRAGVRVVREPHRDL